MEEGRGVGQREISPREGTVQFFSNDSLKNGSVQGSDGTIVRANLYYLAARSRVFEAMLLKEFKEASTSPVGIDFPGATFEALYEYLCTETTQVLDFEKLIGTDVVEDDIDAVRGLLSLAVAADYYELFDLLAGACGRLMKLLVDCPSLSFAVLEACEQEADKEFLKEVAKQAQATLRSNPSKAMDPVALKRLSQQCLEGILRDELFTADEFEVFRLVQKWVEVDKETRSASNPMCHVRLQNISAKLLETEVEASGLVSQQDLFNAYKLQALQAQAMHHVVSQGPRHLPKWRHASTNLASGEQPNTEQVDVLDCAPMTAGEYRWAIHVQEMSQQPAWIGIALSGKEMHSETSLAKHEYGWAYSSQGGIRHRDRNELGHECFRKNSKVTFTLNLSDDNETNGTLSAAIDGGDEFQLFSDLQRELDGPGGFVPAVSLFAPATIDLMGIQRLR